MAPRAEADSLDSQLQKYESLMRRLQAQPGAAALAIGSAEWDWEIWRLGRAVAGSAAPGAVPLAPGTQPDLDVYLSTQVYPAGGHTALIGDFVRALDPADASRPAGSRSRVLVTNVYGQNRAPVPPETCARLGLSAEHVVVLDSGSREQILTQLIDRLARMSVRRLFLFHHSHDPLPAAAAQPGLARDVFLVHHADRTPAFGLHVPGVRVIDLFPIAAARTRLLGRPSALLPLTAPDPGPRRTSFLMRGALVSAASGNEHKFFTPYAFSYAETLARVLEQTKGRHVHIGPLAPDALRLIADALAARGVAADRLVHVPWTASLAATLAAHDVDLFLASFPIDGARTRIEVLASGLPYLRHSTRSEPTRAGGRDEDWTWRTWSELHACLAACADPSVLEREGARLRAGYDRLHAPAVFAETLRGIMAGGPGVRPADQDAIDTAARDSLIQSMASALLATTEMSAMAQAAAEGAAFLGGEIAELRHDAAALTAGTGLRAQVRRWLLGP